MQTGANSFVNGVLDVLASVCSFLFGGHEGLRRVGPVEIAKPRPPIADIDVRIAINATGFHLVHCVIDEKFVYTSTSQLGRSEEHTSELQSLMRISYAVFCLKQQQHTIHTN